MAAAYIAEIQSIRLGGPAMQCPPIIEQVVAITGPDAEQCIQREYSLYSCCCR
jgi:hypothetical protein